MVPEFDEYATSYAELLRDPIREWFGSPPAFFATRKLLLIKEFYRRHGQDTSDVAWLDIGCGLGELLRLGAPAFAEVAGCDPSAGMLEACRDLQVRQQRAPDCIPFADHAFDLATAVCVYHHVAPEWRVPLTREAIRVLKPGGMLCIVEHNPFNPLTQLIVRRLSVDAHARLLSAGAVRRLMSTVGLQIVETRFFLYVPGRLFPRLAGLEDRLAALPLGGQYAVFGRKRPA